MKKIIFILALFVSFVANAQYTPPTGYTNINSRYDWLAGVFRALGLPAGGNAAFTTGQAQRAGSVYYDSTGVDAGLKVWNGSAWVGVGEVTQSALDDTAAAIRADFPTGSAANTNAGAFYRWLKPDAQEIKTWAAGYGFIIDSTTNTDALTSRIDTTLISTRAWRDKLADSLGIVIGTRVEEAKVGADFVISNDSLKNAGFVNIKDFGAVGDGVTNNTTAIQNAANTGKPVYVPPGTFLVTTTVNLATNQAIFGHDWTSIIKITANTAAIKVDSGSIVKNIKFVGNGKAGSGTFNSGVYLNTAVGGVVEGCMFQDFAGDVALNGGGGIFASSIHTTASDGWRIINNYFYNNDCGLNMSTRGEYVTIVGNTFGANNTAILGGAGNLIVGNNIIQNNSIGFKYVATTNGAHSIISENLINHNVTPIDINGLTHTLGFDFNSNMITGGVLRFTNSSNIKFNGGQWNLIDSIAINNSQNIQVSNAWIGTVTAINVYNGGEMFAEFGNTRTSTGVSDDWIKQVNSDKITWIGEMYHNGITPASSSSSDSVWVKDASTKQYKLRAQTDIASAGSGANTALSNLAVVAINTSLISDANNTDDLGSSALAWKDAYMYTFKLKGSTSGTITVQAPATAGTNTITLPASTGTVALTSDLPTLTKNAMVENPTASENLFMFRTPVAITVTDVTAVLVGGTPSVTYNIAFGTDRTSATNVYTAGQTVTSETTGTAASGVNDATIPAGSWVWITTSAATDVTQLNISLTYTED